MYANRYEEERDANERGEWQGEWHSASCNTISVQRACVLRSRRERVEGGREFARVHEWARLLTANATTLWLIRVCVHRLIDMSWYEFYVSTHAEI